MLDDDAAEAWREEQRTTYSSGDSGFLARQQQPMAARLVEVAGLLPGERVLDIGAGTGNVAIEASRRGAVATAVDLTPRQVEAGRRRCEEEGAGVDWRVADAEALPFGDGSFDVALSGFGVVYAARPERAAREITRVLAPAGRVLLTAYPRDSFNGRALEIVNSYLPGAAEQPSVDEYLWSEAEVVHEWFPGRRVELSQQVRRTDPYPSAEAWWAAMSKVPIAERMKEALSSEAHAEFMAEIIGLRTAYAEIADDGTVHPHDVYVIVRIE